MSISPSVPVVQGSRKTSLEFEGDALYLRRPHEDVRIPLAAVGRVRAEGRAVVVELTAPAGGVPVVHRIDGASEAGTTMFAAAVNAALDGAPGRDTTADGSALVEARTRTLDRRERKARLVKRWSAGTTVLVALLCVLIAVAGEPVGVVLFLPMGFAAAGSTVVAVVALSSWYREWRLMRHGVTTFAAEVPDRPGTYLYTDPAGLIRQVSTWAGGMAVKICYDPRDAGNVILPRTALLRRGELALGLFFALGGLVSYGGMIAMTVSAFQGTLGLSEPA
ncbi:hypothetical protein ACIO8G_13245 [Streptomyces sp. NPDC087219]|uniref:hypothetical protein n=1 Tax=Streptomyces sp. NPDC087219 TaxID=3365770 RepID=UPI0038120B23